MKKYDNSVPASIIEIPVDFFKTSEEIYTTKNNIYALNDKENSVLICDKNFDNKKYLSFKEVGDLMEIFLNNIFEELEEREG